MSAFDILVFSDPFLLTCSYFGHDVQPYKRLTKLILIDTYVKLMKKGTLPKQMA